MTKPKFTPGPWKSDGSMIIKDQKKRHIVCQTGIYNDCKYGEQKANANLIAAAPDLHKAEEKNKAFHELSYTRIAHLKNVIRSLNCTERIALIDILSEWDSELINVSITTNEALAKAEGK